MFDPESKRTKQKISVLLFLFFFLLYSIVGFVVTSHSYLSSFPTSY
jgi:hypothetical protein